MTVFVGLLWWSDAISMGGKDIVKMEEEGGRPWGCLMVEHSRR